MAVAGTAIAAPLQPLAKPAAVASDATSVSQGKTRYIVQFSEAPVARMRADFNVATANRAEMQAYRQRLLSDKAPRLAAIARLGGRVVNTVEFAVNGAVIEVDARRVAQIARIPGVKSVRPAGVYTMNQTELRTVGELIGTAQVAAGGNTGEGVAIAIIDSGVDYTHASFKGPGTASYYASAVADAGPTVIGDTAGVFPGGPQVLGGYDWVGETWPNGPVAPDPDPIDNKQAATDFAGHGTNSASAAAGQLVGGAGPLAGSAPGAFILAYRGCSRVSSSCEGSALLNSVDSVIQYAAGFPNGGQPGADNAPLPAGTRVVINMSLGASGANPLIDDLSEASRNAVRAGVMVVASAGNSGDTPFISGTPGSTDMVLSVAASEPEALTLPSLTVGGSVYPLGTAGFGAPFTTPTTLPLAFAGTDTSGTGANLACDPLTVNLTGSAGIADRGACAFTIKTKNVQNQGGTLALIVNNAAGGGPIGLGGTDPTVTISALSIGTDDGATVKAALAATPGLEGSFAPASAEILLPNLISGINIVDQISSFSSRGVSQDGLSLKPDVTAPGTNIFMASIGTGNVGVNSSGTSFSSPLTAGAAALVLSARPDFTPWQVKAALMNTANPDVFASKTAAGNSFVPLARMGAGRVEAVRAVSTGTLAYAAGDIDPTEGRYYNTAVSFGSLDFTAPGTTTVTRTIRVQNLDRAAKTYNVSVAPRFADDTAKGISFTTSVSQLTVPPRGTRSFELIATANGTALPTTLNAALGLPFPSRLNQNDTCSDNVAACAGKFVDLEQDGFVTIDGGPDNQVAVPYLAIPRQASNVQVTRAPGGAAWQNTGAANTLVDVFNLVGVPDRRDVAPTVPGSEEQRIDIQAIGLRYTPNAVTPPAGVPTGDVMEIAVALNYPVTTLRQAVLNAEIDVNDDGVADFTVQNLTTTTGVQAVFITPAGGAPGGAFFRVATPLDSKKAVLPVFPSLMGIAENTRIGVRVFSSTFLGSPAVDTAPNSGAFQYITPNRLVVQPSARTVVAESGASGNLTYVLAGKENALSSPADKGLLLFHGDNPLANEFTVLRAVR
jgi:subtilisin family serine protease